MPGNPLQITDPNASDNPLAYAPVTDADPGLFGRVADVVSGGVDRVSQWLAEQRAKSEKKGLWTGGDVWEGGHPTAKDAVNALQQLAGNFEGGIKAFHGSPHSFERFDPSKIGTGEGAQAYGHGLYFAENEGVARSYRDQLRGDPTIGGQPVDWANPAEHAAAVVAGYNGDRNAAVRDLAGQVASLRNQKGWNETSDPTAAALRYLQAGHELPPVTQPPGHMYEVDINADPDRFLHWDKPLSEQHPDVQAAFSPGGPLAFVGDYLAKNPNMPTTGMHIEDILKMSGHSSRGAAAALSDAGIPGIRYLDQNSRTAGEGTHNVVVFDADTINLLRKYGIAGLIAGGGAAATQGNQ